MEDALLEAKDVYILMKKEFRISRNIRAEWYLNRVNNTITIGRKSNVKDFHGELEAVSVLPQDPPPEWDSDTAHEYKYLVTEKTQLHFLARKYRLVFCLDLSPSLSIVNVVSGKVIFDEIFPTLAKCLKGIVRPFYIPGSQLLFFPKVYITIIAHTPFFKSQPQQVIVQGWLLMNEQENLQSFLKNVRQKIFQIQNQLATLTRETNIKMDEMKENFVETQSSTGSSEFSANDLTPLPVTHPMVSPDIGFVNMLRYGIMALQLLPENSMAGIIVITDGVISLPDATMFDALLVQLRNHTISCSFLQIGPADPPNIWGAGLGYVPFNDLMHFLANATFGAYLTQLPTISDDYENEMNEYHRAFLTWGFQKGLQDLNSQLNFYGSKSFNRRNHLKAEASVIVRKQEWRTPLVATLNAVLSCRLREGYFIKQVKFLKDNVRLILVLPWKYSIAIEYHIFSVWPPVKCEVEAEVWIEASYEFLNDVSKRDVSDSTRSQYRQRMVTKYWQTLKDLKETDLLLVSLQSFPTSPHYFTVPDCVQKGIPVFYMGSQANTPVPSSEFAAFQSSHFVNFWLPVSMLNINKWQKWMHTHRIGIILKHESPLPKNLHITNSSGRYGMIQSRQSEQTLTAFLAKWTDFTLLEGNSYVKFLYKNEEDTSPSSFYVVRITSKRPPLLAIHLAFLGGTSGFIRNKIVNEIKKKILMLTLRLPDRSRDRKAPSHSLQKVPSEEMHGTRTEANSSAATYVSSCTITSKPIEKILIWYDRTPTNLFSSQIQDTTASRFSNPFFNRFSNRSASNNQALLCRYLHHRRWIWGIESSSTPHIPTSAIMRILNTLTRMRLHEGFKFAYSFDGIVTMLREFHVKLDIHAKHNAIQRHIGSADMTSRCVVQYVMFPPHCAKLSESDINEDGEDDSVEADGETQLITECWVEPQNGVVESEGSNSPTFQYQGLNYKQISQSFFPIDQDCIWSLVTFECISQFCQDQDNPSFAPCTNVEGCTWPQGSESIESPPPIQLVPFSLRLTNLLQKCQRAQILLSTLFQDFYSVLVNEMLCHQESESDRSNHGFYSLILDHLNHLHNEKQFYLNSHDNLQLPKLLAERTAEQGGPESPFAHINLDSSSQEVPKWRCFLKFNTQNHFLVTLVPSTYRDLKLLLVNKANILNSERSSFKLITKIDDVDNIENQFGEILERTSSLNDPNYKEEKEASPASHHQSFTSSSSKSSRTSSTALNVDHLRRNSLSSKQMGSSDSPGMDPAQKRTRYKSGPALIHQDNISECVDSIEPSVRERTRSLHSSREEAKTSRSNRLSFKVQTKLEGEHTGNFQSSSKERQDSWAGISSVEKQRKRYISMPAKSHKEMSSLYSKPMASKSISVEMMKEEVAGGDFLEDYRRNVLCGGTVLEECNQPRVIRNHTPIFGSVTLPIYVFDCRLNAVISQFVNREPRESAVGKDVYLDSTFKTDDEIEELKPASDIREEGGSMPSTEHEAAEKHPSPEPLSEESDISVDSKWLRNFSDSIEKCHRRSFVMGVFDALCNNCNVHELDVQAALDQCQEVYLETDISDYLQIVCGHIKDFKSKVNLEQKKLQDSDSRTKNLSPRELRIYQSKESQCVLPKFPLNLLRDYQPNTDLVAIHSGIQQRFVDILQSYFRPVPYLPDYYYYHQGNHKFLSSGSQNDHHKYRFWNLQRRVKKKSGESSITEEDQPDCIGSDAGEDETLEYEGEDREKSIEFRSETGSFYGYPKYMTQISHVTVLSELEEDGQMSVVSLDDRPETGSVPPLFLHLTCTIKIGSLTLGTTPIRTLPTCLGNISECVDVSELDLSKLSVALEVLVMTLFGGATISTGRVQGGSLADERDKRTTSFCSSNSAPQRSSESTNNSCSDNEEMCVEGEDLLSHLPADQQRAISVTFDKICWLVQDEIVSSLLQCYPVTSSTLGLVTMHVSKSQTSSNCFQESVPLKFVYGMEQSMDLFLQEFKKMRINGYQLEEEGDYYYLALNQTIIRRKHPSSLIPPLSIRNISLSRSNSARESKSLRASIESAEELALPKTSLSSPDVLKSPLKRLQQRVSFEGDNCGAVESGGNKSVFVEPSLEVAEKGKWIQRRERKERRDSEKRLVLGSSGSDSDSDSDSSDNVPLLSFTNVTSAQEEVGKVSPKVSEEKLEQTCPAEVETTTSICGNLKSTRRKIDFPERGEEALKEKFQHIEMLAPKPLELIRCGSVNIPSTQASKTEVIRKSASTDDFCPTLHCVDSKGTSASNFWADFSRCNRNIPLDFFKYSGDNNKSRHSSGGDILKSRHNSGTGSLLGGLQSDVSSVVESGQTTDIGCEGDISNSDDCSDWLQDFEGVDPLMPDFWLIVKISNKVVQTYFHHRHEVGLAHWKSVHQDVVSSLRELVKLVNQRLLLINLHDTRVCNHLLEPETSDDIWRMEDFKDGEAESNDYLEAAMKFELGAFSCSQVWSQQFELHPRLKMSGKGGIGMQALHSILNPFSVINRKNMFVCEDTSGIGTNVFYFRLFEQQSQAGSVVETRREESILSRSSSIISLVKRGSKEEDLMSLPEPRPRVSSFIEQEVIMEGVPSLSGQRRNHDFIVLTVHGIAEPGIYIKEKLVQMLQKRLDEAVLDAICLILWNNRHSKLTPEDVRFLQPPYQSPSRVLKFTVNGKSLPYIQAVSYYLRQNLQSSGFTQPKYTDNKAENHFQDFSATDQDLSTESNIFLFVCPQKSGAKGVACIAYSVVDSSGNAIQHNGSCKLSVKGYEDLVSEDDFPELTHTTCLNSSNNKKPEALAVLQFKIWESGRLDSDEFFKSLSKSISHALWDLSMEYRFLVAPISPSSATPPPSVSQPNSPTKGISRQFGSPKFSQSNHPLICERSSSPLSYSQIETSSKTGSRSPLKARHSMDLGREQITSRMDSRFKVEECFHEHQDCGLLDFAPQLLNPVYSSLMIKWLEFGCQLNVPSVRKHVVICPIRSALPTFMTELHKWSSFHLPETTTKIFKCADKANQEFIQVDLSKVTQILKFARNEMEPPDLLITNRNEKQWWSTVYEQHGLDYSNRGNKNMKFQSLQISQPSSSESLTDLSGKNIVSSPTSSQLQQNFSSFAPSLLKHPKSGEFEAPVLVIHRQMFLLATLSGKELTVYTYNWMKDLNEMLQTALSRLCQWTTARTRLLSSLAMQKLGLFHNQPFVRKEADSQKRDQEKKEELNPFLQNWTNVELLIKSPSLNKDFLSGNIERSGRRNQNQLSIHNLTEVLRDAPPTKPLHLSHHKMAKDLLQRHGQQMAEITKISINREKERRLLQATMQNLGAASPSLSDHLLLLFQKHSRIIHFCLTPLLFLPSWRAKVAISRDHSLDGSAADLVQHRSRHESGKSNLDLRRPSIGPTNAPVSISPSQTRRRHPTLGGEDKWHDALCLSYLKEFIQYLYCLGFVTLSITPQHSHKGHQGIDQGRSGQSRDYKVPEQMLQQPTYLVKNLIDGIVVLKIYFCEPYFSAVVSILESSRNQYRRLRIPSQIPSSFIDEFEMIRILLHMHSFTYDYHLRAVCAYVANRQLLFAQGYHLSSFLSDFIKYYNKGPNFGRNLIHAGAICINNTGTPGEQLYNYLLAREKDYHMRVLRMTPTVTDPSSEVYTEFVLVHTKSYQKDSIDYEVTLLVSLDSGSPSTPTSTDSNLYSLYLKFYVILTSRRDMYPTHITEKKSGRFKTVSTALALDQFRSPTTATGSTVNSQTGTPPCGKAVSEFSSQMPPPPPLSAIQKQEVLSVSVQSKSSMKDNARRQSSFSIAYEPVNYLGYFSEYEVFMQQILQQQVNEANRRIVDIFDAAKIHCRRDSLWQRLITGLREEDRLKYSKEQMLTSLNYAEFTELLDLVSVMPISKLDENLLPFLTNPIVFYQSLSRVITSKYHDRNRILTSIDGNSQHVLVFSLKCSETCMMLSIDLHSNQADISCVQKQQPLDGPVDSALDGKTREFVEDFINCCCFHLWSGLI